MKWSIVFAAACLVTVRLVALDGQPNLHDPSTVIAENGKYYVYAHRQRSAGFHVRRWLDVAAGGRRDAGRRRAASRVPM